MKRTAKQKMCEMSIKYKDNEAVKDSPNKYETVTVSAANVIKSWKASLFSYEWLLPDGRIKDLKELPQSEQAKREEIETLLKRNSPLERPILGIGLLENIEIGANKEVFLTLCAHNVPHIEVHIPKNHKEDFTDFIA